MSDERQAFEQLHAIPSGVEWCEKRHIYIHKNYSGLVLHPINESWKAFCEGALWQASRQALEGEPVAEVAQVGGSPVVFWDKSLLVGTKLYTHPASAEVERLQARVAELYDLIKYAQVDSGVCMCGDDIKDHNQSSGHMPLDIWDHAVEQINKEGSSEAFILRKQAEAVEYEIISLCGDLRKSKYRGISVKELLHESVSRSSKIRNKAKKFDDQ